MNALKHLSVFEIAERPAPIGAEAVGKYIGELKIRLLDQNHQLELSRNIEASLRRDLAAALEDNARSTARIKALEARQEHIREIAGGHAVVEGAEEGEG